MKVITPGYYYQLPNIKNVGFQSISFVHERQGERMSNGTSTEDVLKVLIDRMHFLQKELPCRENALVITKLEESLMWLEKRTADRRQRNVEGTRIP